MKATRLHARIQDTLKEVLFCDAERCEWLCGKAISEESSAICVKTIYSLQHEQNRKN